MSDVKKDIKKDVKNRASFDEVEAPQTTGQKVLAQFKPGGVGLIAVAFVLAIIIAVPINIASDSQVPPEVAKLTGIPGKLWLRTLKAVVLPLILASMVLSMHRLRNIEGAGSTLGKTVVGYYFFTTLISVSLGTFSAQAVISNLVDPVPKETLDKLAEASTNAADLRKEIPVLTLTDQVVNMFESFVPSNVVGSMATDQLLAVVVCGITIGLLIPKNPTGGASVIIKFMEEVEAIVRKIISFVILIAPIGVFFLLFASLVIMNLGDIMMLLAINLAVQTGAVVFMFLAIYPLLYFIFTRKNPFWIIPKMLSVPMTALGTASSAATLPEEIKVARELKVPETIAQFALPLGMTVSWGLSERYLYRRQCSNWRGYF